MIIDFNKVPRYVTDEIGESDKTTARRAKGRRVGQIQEWLCYHDLRTGIDRDYGPATERCVRLFQKKKGLPETGAVDPATWLSLVGPMRAALAEPPKIASLTPARVVKKVAQQHLRQHPIELGGDNRGPWVRLYCKGNDGRDWAWCAGFVSLVMAQAYFYMEKEKPFTGSVSCDSLAAQGKAAGLFVPEADITRSRVAWSSFGGCCIFLRRRTDTDWTHTGFALGASSDPRETVFETIEGNTNDEGSREGFEACKRVRSVAGGNYDFVSVA